MQTKRVGGEVFQLDEAGTPTDTALHAAILEANDKDTFDLNDPEQVAARVAAVKARVKARQARTVAAARRRAESQCKFFERRPNVTLTDARIWDAMLDGDPKDVLDGRDPACVLGVRSSTVALEPAIVSA